MYGVTVQQKSCFVIKMTAAGRLYTFNFRQCITHKTDMCDDGNIMCSHSFRCLGN